MRKYQMALPYFPKEDIDEILSQFREILEGREMLTMARQVSAFESEFARYIGAKYAAVTNSCTSALEIALRALGVGKGDEVIVPAQTFIATGSSVALIGARVVFCETDKNFLIDIDDLKRKISSRTKAVIWVHFAGLAHPNIRKVRALLKDKGISLVEDAAHAHGATLDGIKAGSLGDVACFSFFSTKIMTSGEGGMITTDNEELYKKCASMRDRGVDLWNDPNQFQLLGSNRRMTEFQAILGRAQLKNLEKFVTARNGVASTYKRVLNPLVSKGILSFQDVPDSCRHSYWRFSVFLHRDNVNLLDLKKNLAVRGIPIDFPYTPLLHLQPAFQLQRDTKQEFLPATEQLAAKHFCLPMHVLISAKDAEDIAGALLEELA